MQSQAIAKRASHRGHGNGRGGRQPKLEICFVDSYHLHELIKRHVIEREATVKEICGKLPDDDISRQKSVLLKESVDLGKYQKVWQPSWTGKIPLLNEHVRQHFVGFISRLGTRCSGQYCDGKDAINGNVQKAKKIKDGSVDICWTHMPLSLGRVGEKPSLEDLAAVENSLLFDHIVLDTKEELEVAVLVSHALSLRWDDISRVTIPELESWPVLDHAYRRIIKLRSTVVRQCKGYRSMEQLHEGRLACALASLSDVQHDDLQRIWILRTAISESMAVEAFLDGGMSEKIILDRGWEVFNNAQHVELEFKHYIKSIVRKGLTSTDLFTRQKLHIFRDFVKLKLRPLEMSHEGDIKMYEQALVNKVGIEADIAKGIAKIQRGVAIKRSWVGERREQILERLPNYPNAPTNPSPFENDLGEFINRCTNKTLGGMVDFTKTRGLVICGRKGCGKSHLLQKLALELALQCQDEVFANEKVAVPLLVRGADMEAAMTGVGSDAMKTTNPILAYLRHYFQDKLPWRNSFLLKAWKANRVILMLDGLDDLVSNWWPLSKWLDLWQRESRLIILTMQSCHTNLPPFHTEFLQKIEIEPLDEQSVSHLVEHRLMHHPRSEEIMEKITNAIKTLPKNMTEYGMCKKVKDADSARTLMGDERDNDTTEGRGKEEIKLDESKVVQLVKGKDEKEEMEKKEREKIAEKVQSKEMSTTAVSPHLLSLMIHLFRHQHLVPPGSFKVHGRSISYWEMLTVCMSSLMFPVHMKGLVPDIKQVQQKMVFTAVTTFAWFNHLSRRRTFKLKEVISHFGILKQLNKEPDPVISNYIKVLVEKCNPSLFRIEERRDPFEESVLTFYRLEYQEYFAAHFVIFGLMGTKRDITIKEGRKLLQQKEGMFYDSLYDPWYSNIFMSLCTNQKDLWLKTWSLILDDAKNLSLTEIELWRHSGPHFEVTKTWHDIEVIFRTGDAGWMMPPDTVDRARPIEKIPLYYMHCENAVRGYQLLTNLAYVEWYITCNGVGKFLSFYRKILADFDFESERRKLNIEELCTFIEEQADVLGKRPYLVYQQALSEKPASAIHLMAVVKLKNFWKSTLAPQFYCIQILKATRNAGWVPPGTKPTMRYLGRIVKPVFRERFDVKHGVDEVVTIALPMHDGRIYYRTVKLNLPSKLGGSYEVKPVNDDEGEREDMPRHILRSNILPEEPSTTIGLAAGIKLAAAGTTTEAGEDKRPKKRDDKFAESFFKDDQELERSNGGGADDERLFAELCVRCFDVMASSTTTGRGPYLLMASGSKIRAFTFTETSAPVAEFDAGSEVLCLRAEANGNRFVCGTREGLLIVVEVTGGRQEEKFEVVVRICHDMSRQLGIAHKESARQRTAVLCCATYVDLKSLSDDAKSEETRKESRREMLTFVSGGEDGKLRVWNARGECVQTMDGHNGPVTACRIDRSGTPTLISGSMDCTVRMWTLACGKNATSQRVKLPLRGHTAPILSSGIRLSSLYKAPSESEEQCSWPVVVTCSEAEVIAWSFYGVKIAFFPIRIARFGTITRLDIGTKDELVIGTSEGYTLECVFRGPWIDDNVPRNAIRDMAVENGTSRGHVTHIDSRKGVPEGMERVFITENGVPRSVFRKTSRRQGGKEGASTSKTAEYSNEALLARFRPAQSGYPGSDPGRWPSQGLSGSNDPTVDFSMEDFEDLVQAMEKEGLKLNEKSRQAASAIAQAVANTNLTPQEVNDAAIALSLPEKTAAALAKVAAGASTVRSNARTTSEAGAASVGAAPGAASESSSTTSSSGSGEGKKKRKKRGKGRR